LGGKVLEIRDRATWLTHGGAYGLGTDERDREIGDAIRRLEGQEVTGAVDDLEADRVRERRLHSRIDLAADASVAIAREDERGTEMRENATR
jgi:hypothetical protein